MPRLILFDIDGTLLSTDGAAGRAFYAAILEGYVSTPQEVCERWDDWGNYDRARRGEIDNFIGVHERYEPPINPEMTIDLSEQTVTQAIGKILKKLPVMLE